MKTLDLLLKSIHGGSEDVLGINKRNLHYVYPDNARDFFHLVDNKITTKDLLTSQGIPVPRTIMTLSWFGETLDLETTLGIHEQIVIKPNRGRQGNGILVIGEKSTGGYNLSDGQKITWEEIRKHAADIIMGIYSFGSSDLVLIEERIFPHAFFGNIYSRGLADIRVITYHGAPVMSMIRFPTDLSGGKANLHQGGIGVAVDIKTGITTNAVYRKRQITHHPDTKAPLIGITIPFFDELLRIPQRMEGSIPLQYLGFDIVIDRDRGPMVIEVNARPGLEIQNINGKGLRTILDQCRETKCP